MRIAIKIETKRVLEEKAVVAEGATTTRPCSKRRNLLEAVRRKKKIVKVMNRKLASKNSRKQLKPCALTEVHPCTPLTT